MAITLRRRMRKRNVQKRETKKEQRIYNETFTCIGHLPKWNTLNLVFKVFILRAFVQSLMALFKSNISMHLASNTQRNRMCILRTQNRKNNRTIANIFQKKIRDNCGNYVNLDFDVSSNFMVILIVRRGHCKTKSCASASMQMQFTTVYSLLFWFKRVLFIPLSHRVYSRYAKKDPNKWQLKS